MPDLMKSNNQIPTKSTTHKNIIKSINNYLNKIFNITSKFKKNNKSHIKTQINTLLVNLKLNRLKIKSTDNNKKSTNGHKESTINASEHNSSTTTSLKSLKNIISLI